MRQVLLRVAGAVAAATGVIVAFTIASECGSYVSIFSGPVCDARLPVRIAVGGSGVVLAAVLWALSYAKMER